MFKGVRNLFKRISGVSTPLGGITWNPPQNNPFDMAQFNGEILLTSEGNNDVIEFLESNSGLITFLKLTVDACIATQQQADYVKINNLDMSAITAGELAGQTFELQNTLGKIAYIAFDYLPENKPKPSFGGTGTIMVFISGFFEIIPTFHGGPSTVFHLKEIEAPLEAWLSLISRSTNQETKGTT